jgi:hypothetical protein
MNRPALIEKFNKWLNENGYEIVPLGGVHSGDSDWADPKQLIERFFKDGN